MKRKLANIINAFVFSVVFGTAGYLYTYPNSSIIVGLIIHTTFWSIFLVERAFERNLKISILSLLTAFFLMTLIIIVLPSSSNFYLNSFLSFSLMLSMLVFYEITFFYVEKFLKTKSDNSLKKG
jgi:biotin transporter BioY